jgi:hypothetical protein
VSNPPRTSSERRGFEIAHHSNPLLSNTIHCKMPIIVPRTIACPKPLTPALEVVDKTSIGFTQVIKDPMLTCEGVPDINHVARTRFGTCKQLIHFGSVLKVFVAQLSSETE